MIVKHHQAVLRLPWIHIEAARSLNAAGVSALAGEGVAMLPDRGSQRSDLSQTTPAQRPIFRENILNGLPALEFNGGQKMLFALPAGFTQLQAPTTHTLLFVGRKLQTTQNLIAVGNNGASGYIYFNASDGRTYSMGNGSAASTATGHATTFRVYGEVRSGSTVTHYFNTTTASVAINSTQYGFNQLGADFNNAERFMIGFICEMLIFNYAMTTDEFTGWQNYLKNKYALF